MGKNILSVLFITGFLLIAHGQRVTKQCSEEDGWSLSSADYNIGVVQVVIDGGFLECESTEGRRECEELMEMLIKAEEHIIFLLQISEKNGCMTCFLDNALESAISLESAASDLYAIGYPGVNRFEKRATFRVRDMMDKYCPDLNGNWYATNDSKVAININYNNVHKLFEVQLNDGIKNEVAYIEVEKYNRVKIYQSNLFGYLYNNNNNINWGNHEWVRRNSKIDTRGRWIMDGKDIFTIRETGNGQYALMVVSIPSLTALGARFSPGEVFGEFWTQDYTHFSGFIYTKDPNVPQYKIYMKYENGIFYMSESDEVYYDLSKGTKMIPQ